MALVETIIGVSKYKDKKGKTYPNLENFQKRMILPEIQLQKTQIKNNMLFPKEQKDKKEATRTSK